MTKFKFYYRNRTQTFFTQSGTQTLLAQSDGEVWHKAVCLREQVSKDPSLSECEEIKIEFIREFRP